MISVLLLTLNEEANLAACLASVSWADDVLVLDSFSTDRTVEIAREHGARVLQRRFDDFASQRNYGLEHGDLRHDWVLHLDADERVTPALHNELLAVAQKGEKQAYRLASKMKIHGRWLKHAGMYPAYQVRFGRKDALRFKQVGHGQRETLPSEHVGTLREPLEHDIFSKGVADWIERHNRYSTEEAAFALRHAQHESIDWGGLVPFSGPTRRRRTLKNLSYRLPARPLLRFLYVYFGRLGFLDGSAGFHYAVLLSIYEYWIGLKVNEVQVPGVPRGGTDP